MKRAGIWSGLFAATFFAPAGLPLHTNMPAPVPALGHIRGVVYDSLTMEHVANALVWLPGGTRSGIADKDGRFDIDSVPVGKQTIAFSTPALDSIGLGTLGGQFDVRADGVSQVTLTTPSFNTLWRALCKSTSKIGSDSGIAWGTVRDAANDVFQGNAATRFNWHDLHVGADKNVVNEEVTRDVRADSTGSYYACGLPIETAILTEAEGTHSASGIVQYEIGSHRVVRVDLLVSTDMITQPSTKERTPDEQAAALKLRGTSRVQGTVRDDKGVARAGVSVRVAAIDSTVKTGADGQFAFSGLPAGTQVIESMMIGLAPARIVVDLRPGKQADADLTMSTLATNELEAVKVTAAVDAGRFKSDFDARKKSGFGTFLEAKDFENKADALAVIRALPFATAGKNPRTGQIVVTFPAVRLGGNGNCQPLIWIDGVRSDATEASVLEPMDMRAVESYPRGSEAPPQYVGLSQGCGVILFWTKRAKW